MTKTAQILKYVGDNPGLTARKIADALGYNIATASTILNQAKMVGNATKVYGDGEIVWYPEGHTVDDWIEIKKDEEQKTGFALIKKSRGFKGVDIDAIHHKRGAVV